MKGHYIYNSEEDTKLHWYSHNNKTHHVGGDQIFTLWFGCTDGQ